MPKSEPQTEDTPTQTPMANLDPYMTRRRFEIEDLKEDGSNYVAWKTRTMQILRMRGLDGIVTGEDKKSTDTTSKPDAEKEWKARDQEALTQIMLSITDGALKLISHHTSAKPAWDALQARWEGHGVQSLVFLVEKLFSDKATDDDPMADFIAKQRAIATNIHNLGLTLPEALLALILLHTLPPSYDTLRTVVAGSTTLDKLTFDVVASQVLNEEQRLNSGSGLHALYTKNAGKSKGRNTRGKTPRETCKNCGRGGHTKAMCWAKGGDKEGQAPKGRSGKKSEASVNAPTTATTSTPQARLAHVDSSPDPAPEAWVYDGIGQVHAFMARTARSNLASSIRSPDICRDCRQFTYRSPRFWPCPCRAPSRSPSCAAEYPACPSSETLETWGCVGSSRKQVISSARRS